MTTIGNIHSGNGGVRQWAVKNGFNPVFDFKTEQILKMDPKDLSTVRPGAIIAYDPFSGLEVDQISDALSVLDLAEHVVISAIPTGEHHQAKPTVVYRVKQWLSVLSQIGPTIEVFHCNHYSLFMTTK